MTTGPKWKKCIRVGLTLTVLVVGLIPSYELGQSVKAQRVLEEAAQFRAIAYTDPVKQAVEQKLAIGKEVFQATLIVLGVVWGFVIVKREERILQLEDWPEWVMFLFANAWFVASCYSYLQYLDVLAGFHGSAIRYLEPKDLTIPDYRNEKVETFLNFQQTFAGYGFLTSAIMLLSSYLLKEPKK